jgi:hypothetical protein
MSVVGAKLISNERKTMEKQLYPYNIGDASELRQAWEVAYGEMGVYSLIGAMFANLDQATINRLYNQALADVRADMEKAGQL